MGKSLILAIDELASGQAQAFQTVNDAVAALEQSVNKVLLSTSVANANITLTELQFARNGFHRVNGHTAAINLYVPETINTIQTNRLFFVRNDGTGDLTVRTLTSVASVVVAPGSSGIIHAEYRTMRSLSSSGGSGSSSFSLAVFNPTLAAANAELLRYIFVDNVTMQDNFSGSRGSIRVNPTSSMAFDVKKNGVSIGSVTVSTGGVFTFNTTAATTEVFAIGDILTIHTPVAQDPTGADFVINLKGTK
jgi:hypothetical protein